jgi:RNA binding exosome subunit
MPFGGRKSKWEILGEELREQRTDYAREVAEARVFNRELLIRLEKTYANLGTTLGLMGDEMIAMRGEIHELKDAVDAQTDAVMKLLDRFEDPGGRPPV